MLYAPGPTPPLDTAFRLNLSLPLPKTPFFPPFFNALADLSLGTLYVPGGGTSSPFNAAPRFVDEANDEDWFTNRLFLGRPATEPLPMLLPPFGSPTTNVLSSPIVFVIEYEPGPGDLVVLLVMPCAKRFVVLPNTPVLLDNFFSNSLTIELWLYSPGAGLYLLSLLVELVNRELVDAKPTL